MLTNIFVNNIVLIDKMDVALDSGFCVLTGETGAGKSILLDALGLALGRRASPSLIRHGNKQGSVTASFDISNNTEVQDFLRERAIETNGELLLRRVVYHDGKTKAFINDNPSSVNMLGDIAEKLIEIHGQHDQRGILNSATHRSIVDQYGSLEKYVQQVANFFDEYKRLKKTLDDLRESEAKALAEEEYLKFVFKELQELDPQPGLEGALAEKRNRLVNREKLIETISQASDLLQEGDATRIINSAQNLLIKSESLSGNFKGIYEMLERASIEINEALSELQVEASKIDEGNDNLEEIEERLFALRDAARKYNTPVDELAMYRENIREKLDMIANKDELIERLERELKNARSGYIKCAEILSGKRKSAAIKLEKAIAKELLPLKMENTALQVKIESIAEESWGQSGFDKISFLVRTNSGAPFAPIAKIASGGELSRFMLALKVVLSGVKSVPTMIFDEVDTGIGGAVADSVGKRLEILGNKLQVFAITHQPQVAARGNFHLKVQKVQSSEGTTTSVYPLSEKQRQEELARMLAGENITGEARAAAAKLLEMEVV